MFGANGVDADAADDDDNDNFVDGDIDWDDEAADVEHSDGLVASNHHTTKRLATSYGNDGNIFLFFFLFVLRFTLFSFMLGVFIYLFSSYSFATSILDSI